MNLAGPVGTPRVDADAAFCVGEGRDEHQLLWRLDFAVDKAAPHVRPVGRGHAIKEQAARAQVDLAGMDLEAGGTPPLLEPIGLGPRLPYLVAGRIEYAARLEGLHRSTDTLKPP